MGKAKTGKAGAKSGQPDVKNIASEDSSKYPLWWKAAVVIIGLLCCYVNTQHLSTLFENDRHFSHLADFEREMAYRTEMGLYFSYYKTIINADSYSAGLYEITHDNVTEFGHTINTLKRFNLYPEVILSFFYREFKTLASKYDWKVENCWQVNRGQNLPPIEGCEGIGNSHYFYIENVFLLAGTVAGSIFWLGVLLSDSILGGLLSVAAFAFNHGEATRVQWTPPLRESFGFPMIIAQILAVTFVLKHGKVGTLWVFLISIFTCLAMLFWQFSQFAFFTQVASVFVAFALDFVSIYTLKTVALGHIIGFLLSYCLLFGNEMLLTTFYFPSIVAVFKIILVSSLLNRITFRPIYVILNGILFAVLTLFLKLSIAQVLKVEDDAHILDILKSKFTDFATFHSRLYTCSAEFDFLKREAIEKLIMTALIPLALLAILVFIVNFVRTEYKSMLWRKQSDIGKENAEVVYNIVQLAFYTLMALLIMRLKLFFTPHLCIVVSVLANHKLMSNLGFCFEKKYHIAFVILLIAAMGHEGRSNLQKQLSIRGEYSNPEQEELFDWIKGNTNKDAVFAGTMPVMANVKLSTARPIVNHPHYEDVGIRERTMQVYSMFSKKPIEEVHATLSKMGVNYFIFQLFNCAPDKNRPYCAYRGMWDEADPTNANRVSNCDLYHRAIHQNKPHLIYPFTIVFNPRNNYIVLKV